MQHHHGRWRANRELDDATAELREAENKLASCEGEQQAIASFARSQPRPQPLAVARNNNLTAPCGFLTADFFACARRYMDFLQHDIADISARRNDLDKQRLCLWCQ